MNDETCSGLTKRYAKSGIPIIRLHYSADPDRNPAINPNWRNTERKKYTSQAAWDREQEIVHEAGGGELVLAEILNKYAHKIIITDPEWRPSEHWQSVGGFDHGKTNPTALSHWKIDFDGVLYACGEYYMPGLGPKEHRAVLEEHWPAVFDIPRIFSDPTIFDDTQAQKDGTFKSIAYLYSQNDPDPDGTPPPMAFQNLCPAPERNELLGMERILAHWHDLDNREPTLKIVCRMDYSQRRHGLYQNDCPNLLWELKRTRREKLSAQQLMRQNPSEKIVDKDNHLRDTAKYVVLAQPSPSQKPRDMRLAEVMKGLDPTNAMISRLKFDSAENKARAPVFVGGQAAKRQKMYEQALAKKRR